MRKIKNGDTIRVHYTGKLEDGTEFDSSLGRDPLEFTIGSGKLIPGFEKGVVGMETGEKKTITLPPKEAYGEKRPELIVEMEKNNLPDDISPEVGLQLQISQTDGNPIIVTITAVSDDKITLDANPPLAGQKLIFEIELLEVV